MKLKDQINTLISKQMRVCNKLYKMNVWIVRDGKLLVRSQGTSGPSHTFPCSICLSTKDDRSELGEFITETQHIQQVIQSRWNPEDRGSDARYLISKGASSYGSSFFAPYMYAMDELHMLLNLKLNYENSAISILSFCTSQTSSMDPECLSGIYSGNKEIKQAKKQEALNKRTIGVIRWEQHMRAIHGKSSSVKVGLNLKALACNN